jgi:hypothetical protein
MPSRRAMTKTQTGSPIRTSRHAKEGSGVSNNPIKHRTHSFDEAKFSAQRTEQVMEITLIY